MPLDPRARRFLDMTAAGAAARTGPPTTAERRTALAKLMQFARADRLGPPGRDLALAGPGGALPCRLYDPTVDAHLSLPGLVFFHGGGLVAGGLDTHDTVVRALAVESGCRILAVDYRLAPEHPFPAAPDDAMAAVRAVGADAAAFGIDPDRLAIGGESAGAALAVLAALDAVRSGGPRLAAQFLICPVMDFAGKLPSRTALGDGYLIDRITLESDLADYLAAGEDPADPRVSPLWASDLAGLPPAVVHTAECDPLHAEGVAYVERLRAAGIAVVHVDHPGMPHNFHALGAVLPQARAALATIGADLRTMLGA